MQAAASLLSAMPPVLQILSPKAHGGSFHCRDTFRQWVDCHITDKLSQTRKPNRPPVNNSGFKKNALVPKLNQ
jgi:hypothetical protein